MKAALAIALIAPAALAQEAVRVEPRLFVKDHRTFLSGGVTWLARADYYNSPGFLFSGAYYLRESDAAEVRAVVFASWTGSSADEVFRGTGLVPDTPRPIALVSAGWRHSLAYGKVTTGTSVLHFDVQAGGDLGLLVTDKAAEPSLIGFFGLVARLGPHAYGQLDLSLIGGRESRSAPVFTVGFLPMLSVGGSL